MSIVPTSIDGLFVVESAVHCDNRGFFRETYRQSEIAAVLGRSPVFRQNNHSRSAQGVLRGFHNEAWDKLIYVARGTAFVAVADVRPASATFGRACTFLIGDEPGRFVRIFVQKGLSNAFYCLTDVDYINDVSEEFNPAMRGGVSWADRTLAIDWPNKNPILSDTDASLPTLRDLFPRHTIFQRDRPI